MDVGKNILETSQEKKNGFGGWNWYTECGEMGLTWRILEGQPEGTWRKGRTKERWMNGVTRCMANHGQTEGHKRDGSLP